MPDSRLKERLALQGGMKAVSTIEGKGKPKIGVDEFMSVVDRFGLSKDSMKKIREIVTADVRGEGPFLANYYSGLKESKVQAFERVAREVFGVKHAIGVSSGTASLHCAFVAAGVGPGKEVICPAIGFFATPAAVVAANGVPVFCDVDESLSIDPSKIEALINPRTVAIVPTAVMGSVCNMTAIMKIARKRKLRVIEDCAQSCGGRHKGRLVGTIGDMGCFSISAYKIVGGGEGGLILTNDERLYERAQQVAECGGLWRPDRFGPERYKGELFCGTNYRMSELEAAVDVVQLKKTHATVKRFNTVKTRILKRLKTYREIVPQFLNDPEGEVGYLLRFFPESIELGEEIVAALQAEGIGCGMKGHDTHPDWHLSSYMLPVILKGSPTDAGCPYECPHYIENGGCIEYSQGDCPVAEDLYHRAVSISLNQWMTAKDCRSVAGGINKVLSAYCTEDPNATPWL